MNTQTTTQTEHKEALKEIRQEHRDQLDQLHLEEGTKESEGSTTPKP